MAIAGRWQYALVTLTAAWLAGCGATAPQAPPQSMPEYRQADRNASYARRTIVLHNLQRVLDEELSTEARLASLEVVRELAGNDRQVRQALSSLRADEQQGPVARAVAEMLGRPQVSRRVQQPEPDETRGRPARLTELMQRRGADALPDVVRAWARDERAEQAYAQAVLQLTGEPANEALLRALNEPDFPAPGAALQVLSRRLEDGALRRRLLTVEPESRAVRALQLFLRHLDYLATTPAQLAVEVHHLTEHPQDIPEAGELAAWWQRQSDYRFRLRDFHLLARLAGDPRRERRTRQELVERLSEFLEARRHVEATGSGRGRFYGGNLTMAADRLTLADLWNLDLLTEAFQRPQLRRGIQAMAQRDLADRDRVWGGLVQYRDGRAMLMIYSSQPSLSTEHHYVAARAVEEAQADALAQFHGHFGALAERVGPDRAELGRAAEGSYYGLIVTGLDEQRFSAHYYNPSEQVVSLGVYRYAE